ncbi:hypothetical protein SAMN05444170_1033 [Bradyrhizobium erythrophlei]|uniref:Uncharacterized protein n=1 Tax=Bradyrhizobium erythrophlei TaxID=1437360 RepID=A0A1M7T7F0_9BRAD|nr:hypothetical protein SAMN05444170_1033 [Bradyrhizobium erythrophlei]
MSRATQAITRPLCINHIESAGKRRLQQSGKYRVNKNDEEIPVSSGVIRRVDVAVVNEGQNPTTRHHRACPGDPRLSPQRSQDVDARHPSPPRLRRATNSLGRRSFSEGGKAGHDVVERIRLRLRPGSQRPCRARPAPPRDARSARGRASRKHSRARPDGRTRRRQDRRRARRRCRP